MKTDCIFPKTTILKSYIISIILLSISFPAHANDIKELEISVKLKNEVNGKMLELPEIEFTLSTEAVSITGNHDIMSLLSSRGFLSDGESLDIVYYLNPELDENSINNATEVIMPKVTGGKYLANAFKEDYFVEFTTNTEVKEKLIADFGKLEVLSKKIYEMDLNRFESNEQRDSIIELVSNMYSVSEYFAKVINERSTPLSSDMLQNMSEEVEIALSILEIINRGNEIVRSKDVDKLRIICEDIQLQAQLKSETRGPNELPRPPKKVKVKVKLFSINMSKKTELHYFTVYYVSRGLYNNKYRWKTCNGVTSPVTCYMEESFYCIWAVVPGHPEKISKIVEAPITIRDDKEPLVELLMP